MLIAVGAILRFAVTVTARGFNIHTIGVILIVVGIVGLLLSVFWTTIWAGRRGTVETVGPSEPVAVRRTDLP